MTPEDKIQFLQMLSDIVFAGTVPSNGLSYYDKLDPEAVQEDINNRIQAARDEMAASATGTTTQDRIRKLLEIGARPSYGIEGYEPLKIFADMLDSGEATDADFRAVGGETLAIKVREFRWKLRCEREADDAGRQDPGARYVRGTAAGERGDDGRG